MADPTHPNPYPKPHLPNPTPSKLLPCRACFPPVARAHVPSAARARATYATPALTPTQPTFKRAHTLHCTSSRTHAARSMPHAHARTLRSIHPHPATHRPCPPRTRTRRATYTPHACSPTRHNANACHAFPTPTNTQPGYTPHPHPRLPWTGVFVDATARRFRIDVSSSIFPLSVSA